MPHQSKDRSGSAAPDLMQFVRQHLSGLSEAFASGPLMQLRISSPGASVTLVKAAGIVRTAHATEYTADRRQAPHLPHAYLPDGEPGRAFDTVNADVVGIFHSASDLPNPGEPVDADRVLGYIEALKLHTPVRAGIAGRLVGQVAEDGQAVDFGETLFVVDGGPAEPAAVEPQQPEVEPPRI